jgi:hypothetical protein
MPSGSWGCLLARAWERADGPSVGPVSQIDPNRAHGAGTRTGGVFRPRSARVGTGERAGYSIPNERFVLGTIA